jgi:hypothetical protein
MKGIEESSLVHVFISANMGIGKKNRQEGVVKTG